jgi:hypothetical protein
MNDPLTKKIEISGANVSGLNDVNFSLLLEVNPEIFKQ